MMKPAIARSIKWSILATAVLSLVAKLLLFFRNILIVNEVGVGLKTDAFFAALTLIDAVIILSGIQALYSVVTSTLSKQASDAQFKREYFTSLLLLLLGYAGLYCLVAAFFPQALVDAVLRGMSPDAKLFTNAVLRLLAVNIFLIATFKTCNSIFGVHRQFFMQNALLVAINLVVVGVILLSHGGNAVLNVVVALPLCYLAALIVQLWLLAPHGYRIVKVSRNTILRHWKSIVTLALPLTLVTGLESLSNIVDKAIASYFGEGVITYLTLAQSLTFFSVTAIILPIAQVVFPEFARLHHANEHTRLKALFLKTIEAVSLIFIPIALYMIIFNIDLVRGVYYGKNFSNESVAVVARIIFVYGFALLFNPFFLIATFLLQGAQKNITVGWCGFFAFICNIICSITFSRIWGYIGIPLGSIVANMLLCATLMIAIRRELAISLPGRIIRPLLFAGAASLLGIAGVAGIRLFEGVLPDGRFIQLGVSLCFFPLCWGAIWFVYAKILHEDVLRFKE
jgi:putative peptidoglycan lipid II flippase